MMFIFQNKENKDLINAINFILGYKTKKPELFKLALLHKSIKSEESNERLEFLGDSVLGSSVTSYLFRRYDKDEGFCTKLKTKMINTDAGRVYNLALSISELTFSQPIDIEDKVNTEMGLIEQKLEEGEPLSQKECGKKYTLVKKLFSSFYLFFHRLYFIFSYTKKTFIFI